MRLVTSLSLGGAWLLPLVGCEPARKPPAPLEGANLLLITLDTTRADRIGCYGYAEARTPALDSLAARGAAFERAFAQVPITTPSHCTLLTGRFPREHGVHANGRTALPASLPTLATVFRKRGHATGAFVASFVLDDRFGLARGFDVYEDDMGGNPFRQQRMRMQIPADLVTHRALSWLESVKGGPFFCWVHYFDPHVPYAPPAAFAEAAAHPYDGEIAFMDSQIGRLSEWLAGEGLEARTLVVAVGDHGESFGEHGENGHGMFLYNTTVRVPMILAHPTVTPVRTWVSEVVGVVDLFPTILELFGAPAPDGLLSESFAALLVGSDPSPRSSYAESLYARAQHNWAEQRSLTLRRWKYISSARPELYDLEADPDEQLNLIDKHPDLAAEMQALLMRRFNEMAAGEAVDVSLNASARQGLESLGYLTGGAEPASDEFLTAGLADPKDRVRLADQLEQARQLSANGQFGEAAERLEAVVAEAPDSPAARHALASCYLAIRRPEDARRELAKAVELAPSNTLALSGLGNVLVALDRHAEAIEHYKVALAINDDPQVHAMLGVALSRVGRTIQAIEHLRRAFAVVFPGDAAVYEEASTVLANRGLLQDAVELYEQAFRQGPARPDARFRLGMAFLRTDRGEAAAKYIQQAVEAKPALGRSLIEAGVARAGAGELTKAKRMFSLAARFDGLAAVANYYLGQAAVQEGDEASANRYFAESVEADPTYEPAVLARTQRQLAEGKADQAVAVLERAVASAPQNVRFLVSLAQILATTRNDALRDGARAVRLAERAAGLSNRQDPAALLTLAAAQAETGDYQAAVTTAREALSRATAEGEAGERISDLIRTQLAAFEAGQPYRNPRF